MSIDCASSQDEQNLDFYKVKTEALEIELLKARSRIAALEAEITEQLKKSTQFHSLALEANFKLDLAKKENELSTLKIKELNDKCTAVNSEV